MELEDMEVPLTVPQRMGLAISRLPILKKDEIPLDDTCPICLNLFSHILEGEVQIDSTLVGLAPKHLVLSGVTKLEGCGHIFCRVDLIDWILSRHGTCPACRHEFCNLGTYSDSDAESIPDGDYVPGEDEDEDEDDGFMDTDGFTDASDWDFETDEMDVASDISQFDAGYYQADAWPEGVEDDVTDNLGLSDGTGSEGLPESDSPVSGDEEPAHTDNARVAEDDFPREGPSTGGPKP
ncbi:hypothetical protein OBBRIDRAFT_886482 [Obba rivulosa]|uniref:RING-type domain-containing protein n=1 Tax=Obba rivulosa TaxID=1052685 RepID=A0A8E2AZZ9_9APHY|nr:hypothetical protein OBBRIDRAFT_886482 [Obba rivulosa]